MKLFSLAPIVALLVATGVCAQAAPSVARVAASAELATGTPPLGLAILGEHGEVRAVCPLERTDVKADIAGQLARVVVVQHFSNPSTTPIEALYTFPLPHDSAVEGMTFHIGERLIVGEIKRRAEATQIYETAKANGQNAALLDQERPNIFSQRVANILPGQKISVEISFTQPVVYRAGRYEWEFPTVVGPRYISPQVTDALRITPPITPEGTRAGHDLTMNVHLRSAVALGAITSALHAITVEKLSDDEANISLKDGATLPNKDFILRFAPRDNALQTGLLVRSDGDGGGWFQLVVQPPTDAPKTQIEPKEMVFVIDQTGSQRGEPIEKAKETMRYCIGNLNPGDTFQLLGFNTDLYPCFPKPVAATPENIRTALAFLKPLEGDGGTDIQKATDYALSLPDDPDRPRIVCFMTDGFVGDDESILHYVRDHRGRARMFPFGVGKGVNRYLIDGMAREGRGVPEYALLNGDGQKIAARFYERIANPVLLDVKADWQGLPVSEVFPKVVPDVFESGPLVLTGRFSRPVAGDVIVSGRAAGKLWTKRVRVDFTNSELASGAALPSAWARLKIDELTNQRPEPNTSGAAAKDLAEQITKVALDYHLMSAYTSFVAVEPTVVNVGGQQKTVEVPVEMADGVSYQGIFGRRNMPMIGQFFDSNGIVAGGFESRSTMSGFARSGAVTHFAIGPTFGDESKSVSRAALPSAAELAAMTPAERVAAVRAAKMTHEVRALLEPAAPHTVTVQLWLSPLADATSRAALAAKLKALGWTQLAVLTPGKLVLGTVSSDKLDELAALDGVALVDVPHFK